jgi:hypothetical protein
MQPAPLHWALDRVDGESLARAEAFCAEFIARLDAEVGPDLPPRTAAVSERDDRPGRAR